MTLAERTPVVFVADNRQDVTAIGEEPFLSTLHVGQLHIAVRPDEDGWLAVEDTTGLFSEADDAQAALNDLVRGLYELKAELEAHRDRLSDHLSEQLRVLQRSLPS